MRDRPKVPSQIILIVKAPDTLIRPDALNLLRVHVLDLKDLALLPPEQINNRSLKVRECVVQLGVEKSCWGYSELPTQLNED